MYPIIDMAYMCEFVNIFQIMCSLLVIIDERSLNMYSKDFCSLGTSWSFINFSCNLNVIYDSTFFLTNFFIGNLPGDKIQVVMSPMLDKKR